jgi:hypothetical protein
MRAAATTKPATMGTLTVRAVQKTAGGPAVAGDPVTVEIYNEDKLMNKLEAKLDGAGTVKLPDIPFGAQYGQFVRVNHAGVEYTAQATPTDDAKSSQEVAVNVFESTDQKPTWEIKMRHMILQPIAGGFQVMDVLAVDNPSDKAWLGNAGEGAKRTTFVLDLPASASDIQLEGAFHECCVDIKDGKLTNSMALLPGVNKYQINYTIPAKDGHAVITATAPEKVRNMIVMLPDDESAASATGLDGPSTVDMGGGKTRFFRGENIAPGANVSVTVATSTPAAASSAPHSSSIENAPKLGRIIAGGGALLIFIVGGTFMFLRAPKAKTAR